MFRIAARRLPRTAVQVRFTSSAKEGSVAQSKGFAEKERSQEAMFVRQHEEEQIKKLKAQMAKAQSELAKTRETVEATQAAINELEGKK